jgi:type IV pilus biogenesis protein CpaD/CtpE
MLAAVACLHLAGCASENQASVAAAPVDARPVVHEYRTGSIIASHDRHVTTPEERQAAEQAAAAIRALPGYGKTGN